MRAEFLTFVIPIELTCEPKVKLFNAKVAFLCQETIQKVGKRVNVSLINRKTGRPVYLAMEVFVLISKNMGYIEVK
jgi:hypothetical protein